MMQRIRQHMTWLYRAWRYRLLVERPEVRFVLEHLRPGDIAIDIGAQSHHTDEYVVFWLPRQRLLFQGDLGWFGPDDAPRAGGRRARGLLQAIDERNLPVETLLQGWPVLGSGRLPLQRLRELLAP